MALLRSILATILYIVSIELIGIGSPLAYSLGFHNSEEYFTLIQGILQVLFVIAFLRLFTKTSLRNVPQATSATWYLLAIGAGLVFVFLQSPLQSLYNMLFGTDFIVVYEFDGLPEFKNINILSVTLFIPLGEELFFRQYIQKNLQEKYPPLLAIIMASLLFALIHAPYLSLLHESLNANWNLFYLTFFGGLISGFLFYRSRSIGPSILMHCTWNIFATLV